MLRVIGDKLNKLEGKNSAFKEHLHELEADYKRVSGHFDDILASHEKTFLSVRRSIEQGCINQQLSLNSLRHTYLRAEVTLDILHLSDAFSYFYILNIRIDFIYTNEHKDLNLQAKLGDSIYFTQQYPQRLISRLIFSLYLHTRDGDQSDERQLGELELKMLHPIKHPQPQAVL